MNATDEFRCALQLRHIDKRYGPTMANRGVSLSVERGSIHALVGENGAGKSTLMKIAYGHVRADGGAIAIREHTIDPTTHSPRGAIAHGLGMVHQHFMLVGPLTVLENVVLGREPTRRGLLELGGAAAELVALSRRYGLAVDPDARIDELGVGQRQRVEIVKVLSQGSDILILDEPTAVLTPGETAELFAVLKKLCVMGMTVVLITHKLDEVLAVADRVTVMRAGEVVEELPGEGLSAQRIAEAMVGRPVLFTVAKQPAQPGEPVLVASALRVRATSGAEAVREVSFEVRSGEIVGIAGVEGNGQSELIEALAGVRPVVSGTVTLAGHNVSAAPVLARGALGLAHVPEDRLARGLVLDFSVADNLILGQQRDFAGPTGLDRTRIAERAAALLDEFEVRPRDPRVLAASLSGGNQQKLVIARELSRPALRLLLCAQPTRGVDIAAIEIIHRRIIAARDAGLGVLLVSSDLSELCALADRVLVLYGGWICAELSAADLAADGARSRIGQLMTGARGQA